MLFNIWADLRYAARSLGRTPGFVAAATLTLALGIGVNVAVFSLYQQILLRPLPVAEPERLVNFVDAGPKLDGINFGSMAGGDETLFSYPMFRDLERAQAPFTGIAAHRLFDASLSTGERAERETGLFVSGSYFPLLGLEPAVGRLLGAEDDAVEGQPDTVVLSHAYWQNELGGDEQVVGRTLIVNGKRLTIVGVAPRGFHGTTVGTRASVFVPITFRGVDSPFAIPNHADRSFYWVHLFARLRPNIGRATAAAAIEPIYRAILSSTERSLLADADENKREAFRTKSLVLAPGERGQSSSFGPVRERLRMLLAVSAAILLLCCANIAGLMMVRGSARIGEMAVRASMGATRCRLARQLLIEALLLTAPATIASSYVATLALSGVANGVFGIPPAAFEAELSATAALVAIGIALLSAVVFGLIPLGGLVRTEPGKTLKAFGVRQTAGRRVARFRAALATTQIAIAMALVAVTSVLAQSLANIARIDLGFDPDSVVTFSMSPEASGYAPDASAALFDRIERNLAAIPGVDSAASSGLPLLTGGSLTMNGGRTALNFVGPGFFRTLGIGLLSGRDFGDADVDGAPPVVIVNESFANRLGPDRNPVGERVQYGSGDREIVGVVADTIYANVTSEILPQMFVPRRQIPTQGSAAFYVRGAMPPAELMSAVRETVTRTNPAVPITALRTMQQQVRENLATERFAATIAAVFAVLATVLAGIGLYGVLAYTVALRSRELGLRVALGAPRNRILSGVLRQAARMTLPGIALGVVTAWLLGRVTESLLFGVAAANPFALGAAAFVLAVVALGAAYLPARRASGADPVVALRYE